MSASLADKAVGEDGRGQWGGQEPPRLADREGPAPMAIAEACGAPRPRRPPLDPGIAAKASVDQVASGQARGMVHQVSVDAIPDRSVCTTAVLYMYAYHTCVGGTGVGTYM